MHKDIFSHLAIHVFNMYNMIRKISTHWIMVMSVPLLYHPFSTDLSEIYTYYLHPRTNHNELKIPPRSQHVYSSTSCLREASRSCLLSMGNGTVKWRENGGNDVNNDIIRKRYKYQWWTPWGFYGPLHEEKWRYYWSKIFGNLKGNFNSLRSVLV